MNTLNVEKMGIVNTKEFFDGFIGKQLTIWTDGRPLFFSLSKLASYEFDLLTEPALFIMRGAKDEGFGVSFDVGFGFRPSGEHKRYWVDAMNEKEALVITYSGKGSE